MACSRRAGAGAPAASVHCNETTAPSSGTDVGVVNATSRLPTGRAAGAAEGVGDGVGVGAASAGRNRKSAVASALDPGLPAPTGGLAAGLRLAGSLPPGL